MLGTIHGRLVRDPELKTGTKDGKQWFICNFSVASDNMFGEETTFYDCHISGKRAEAVAKWFTKGKEIVVHGELRQEPYTKDGKTYRPFRLAVDSFDFCGTKESGNAVSESAPVPPAGMSDLTEDIPF